MQGQPRPEVPASDLHELLKEIKELKEGLLVDGVTHDNPTFEGPPWANQQALQNAIRLDIHTDDLEDSLEDLVARDTGLQYILSPQAEAHVAHSSRQLEPDSWSPRRSIAAASDIGRGIPSGVEAMEAVSGFAVTPGTPGSSLPGPSGGISAAPTPGGSAHRTPLASLRAGASAATPTSAATPVAKFDTGPAAGTPAAGAPTSSGLPKSGNLTMPATTSRSKIGSRIARPGTAVAASSSSTASRTPPAGPSPRSGSVTQPPGTNVATTPAASPAQSATSAALTSPRGTEASTPAPPRTTRAKVPATVEALGAMATGIRSSPRTIGKAGSATGPISSSSMMGARSSTGSGGSSSNNNAMLAASTSAPGMAARKRPPQGGSEPLPSNVAARKAAGAASSHSGATAVASPRQSVLASGSSAKQGRFAAATPSAPGNSNRIPGRSAYSASVSVHSGSTASSPPLSPPQKRPAVGAAAGVAPIKRLATAKSPSPSPAAAAAAATVAATAAAQGVGAYAGNDEFECETSHRSLTLPTVGAAPDMMAGESLEDLLAEDPWLAASTRGDAGSSADGTYGLSGHTGSRLQRRTSDELLRPLADAMAADVPGNTDWMDEDTDAAMTMLMQGATGLGGRIDLVAAATPVTGAGVAAAVVAPSAAPRPTGLQGVAGIAVVTPLSHVCGSLLPGPTAAEILAAASARAPQEPVGSTVCKVRELLGIDDSSRQPGDRGLESEELWLSTSTDANRLFAELGTNGSRDSTSMVVPNSTAAAVAAAVAMSREPSPRSSPPAQLLPEAAAAASESLGVCEASSWEQSALSLPQGSSPAYVPSLGAAAASDSPGHGRRCSLTAEELVDAAGAPHMDELDTDDGFLCDILAAEAAAAAAAVVAAGTPTKDAAPALLPVEVPTLGDIISSASGRRMLLPSSSSSSFVFDATVAMEATLLSRQLAGVSSVLRGLNGGEDAIMECDEFSSATPTPRDMVQTCTSADELQTAVDSRGYEDLAAVAGTVAASPSSKRDGEGPSEGFASTVDQVGSGFGLDEHRGQLVESDPAVTSAAAASMVEVEPAVAAVLCAQGVVAAEGSTSDVSEACDPSRGNSGSVMAAADGLLAADEALAAAAAASAMEMLLSNDVTGCAVLADMGTDYAEPGVGLLAVAAAASGAATLTANIATEISLQQEADQCPEPRDALMDANGNEQSVDLVTEMDAVAAEPGSGLIVTPFAEAMPQAVVAASCTVEDATEMADCAVKTLDALQESLVGAVDCAMASAAPVSEGAAAMPWPTEDLDTDRSDRMAAQGLEHVQQLFPEETGRAAVAMAVPMRKHASPPAPPSAEPGAAADEAVPLAAATPVEAASKSAVAFAAPPAAEAIEVDAGQDAATGLAAEKLRACVDAEVAAAAAASDVAAAATQAEETLTDAQPALPVSLDSTSAAAAVEGCQGGRSVDVQEVALEPQHDAVGREAEAASAPAVKEQRNRQDLPMGSVEEAGAGATIDPLAAPAPAAIATTNKPVSTLLEERPEQPIIVEVQFSPAASASQDAAMTGAVAAAASARGPLQAIEGKAAAAVTLARAEDEAARDVAMKEAQSAAIAEVGTSEAPASDMGPISQFGNVEEKASPHVLTSLVGSAAVEGAVETPTSGKRLEEAALVGAVAAGPYDFAAEALSRQPVAIETAAAPASASAATDGTEMTSVESEHGVPDGAGLSRSDDEMDEQMYDAEEDGFEVRQGPVAPHEPWAAMRPGLSPFEHPAADGAAAAAATAAMDVDVEKAAPMGVKADRGRHAEAKDGDAGSLSPAGVETAVEVSADVSYPRMSSGGMVDAPRSGRPTLSTVNSHQLDDVDYDIDEDTDLSGHYGNDSVPEDLPHKAPAGAGAALLAAAAGASSSAQHDTRSSVSAGEDGAGESGVGKGAKVSASRKRARLAPVSPMPGAEAPGALGIDSESLLQPTLCDGGIAADVEDVVEEEWSEPVVVESEAAGSGSEPEAAEPDLKDVKCEAEAGESEPAAVDSEPEAVELRAEAVEPEPANVDSQPETVELRAEAGESEPAAVDSEPEAVEPEPEAAEPEPVAVDSEPEAVELRAEAGESEPAAVDSEPGAVEPEPAAVDSEPEAVESESEVAEAEAEVLESEPGAGESEAETVESEPGAGEACTSVPLDKMTTAKTPGVSASVTRHEDSADRQGDGAEKGGPNTATATGCSEVVACMDQTLCAASIGADSLDAASGLPAAAAVADDMIARARGQAHGALLVPVSSKAEAEHAGASASHSTPTPFASLLPGSGGALTPQGSVAAPGLYAMANARLSIGVTEEAVLLTPAVIASRTVSLASSPRSVALRSAAIAVPTVPEVEIDSEEPQLLHAWQVLVPASPGVGHDGESEGVSTAKGSPAGRRSLRSMLSGSSRLSRVSSHRDEDPAVEATKEAEDDHDSGEAVSPGPAATAVPPAAVSADAGPCRISVITTTTALEQGMSEQTTGGGVANVSNHLVQDSVDARLLTDSAMASSGDNTALPTAVTNDVMDDAAPSARQPEATLAEEMSTGGTAQVLQVFSPSHSVGGNLAAGAEEEEEEQQPMSAWKVPTDAGADAGSSASAAQSSLGIRRSLQGLPVASGGSRLKRSSSHSSLSIPAAPSSCCGEGGALEFPNAPGLLPGVGPLTGAAPMIGSCASPTSGDVAAKAAMTGEDGSDHEERRSPAWKVMVPVPASSRDSPDLVTGARTVPLGSQPSFQSCRAGTSRLHLASAPDADDFTFLETAGSSSSMKEAAAISTTNPTDPMPAEAEAAAEAAGLLPTGEITEAPTGVPLSLSRSRSRTCFGGNASDHADTGARTQQPVVGSQSADGWTPPPLLRGGSAGRVSSLTNVQSFQRGEANMSESGMPGVSWIARVSSRRHNPEVVGSVPLPRRSVGGGDPNVDALRHAWQVLHLPMSPGSPSLSTDGGGGHSGSGVGAGAVSPSAAPSAANMLASMRSSSRLSRMSSGIPEDLLAELRMQAHAAVGHLQGVPHGDDAGGGWADMTASMEDSASYPQLPLGTALATAASAAATETSAAATTGDGAGGMVHAWKVLPLRAPAPTASGLAGSDAHAPPAAVPMTMSRALGGVRPTLGTTRLGNHSSRLAVTSAKPSVLQMSFEPASPSIGSSRTAPVPEEESNKEEEEEEKRQVNDEGQPSILAAPAEAAVATDILSGDDDVDDNGTVVHPWKFVPPVPSASASGLASSPGVGMTAGLATSHDGGNNAGCTAAVAQPSRPPLGSRPSLKSLGSVGGSRLSRTRLAVEDYVDESYSDSPAAAAPDDDAADHAGSAARAPGSTEKHSADRIAPANEANQSAIAEAAAAAAAAVTVASVARDALMGPVLEPPRQKSPRTPSERSSAPAAIGGLPTGVLYAADVRSPTSGSGHRSSTGSRSTPMSRGLGGLLRDDDMSNEEGVPTTDSPIARALNSRPSLRSSRSSNSSRLSRVSSARDGVAGPLTDIREEDGEGHTPSQSAGGAVDRASLDIQPQVLQEEERTSPVLAMQAGDEYTTDTPSSTSVPALEPPSANKMPSPTSVVHRTARSSSSRLSRMASQVSEAALENIVEEGTEVAASSQPELDGGSPLAAVADEGRESSLALTYDRASSGRSPPPAPSAGAARIGSPGTATLTVLARGPQMGAAGLVASTMAPGTKASAEDAISEAGGLLPAWKVLLPTGSGLAASDSRDADGREERTSPSTPPGATWQPSLRSQRSGNLGGSRLRRVTSGLDEQNTETGDEAVAVATSAAPEGSVAVAAVDIASGEAPYTGNANILQSVSGVDSVPATTNNENLTLANLAGGRPELGSSLSNNIATAAATRMESGGFSSFSGLPSASPAPITATPLTAAGGMISKASSQKPEIQQASSPVMTEGGSSPRMMREVIEASSPAPEAVRQQLADGVNAGAAVKSAQSSQTPGRRGRGMFSCLSCFGNSAVSE